MLFFAVKFSDVVIYGWCYGGTSWRESHVLFAICHQYCRHKATTNNTWTAHHGHQWFSKKVIDILLVGFSNEIISLSKPIAVVMFERTWRNSWMPHPTKRIAWIIHYLQCFQRKGQATFYSIILHFLISLNDLIIFPGSIRVVLNIKYL